MTNQVFLLLPISIQDKQSLETVYLRIEEEWSLDKVRKLADSIRKTMTLCDHEDMLHVYDQRKYLAIRNSIKEQTDESSKRPSAIELLDGSLKNFQHYENVTGVDIKTPVKVNRVEMTDTIMNAFANSQNMDIVVLVDADALNVASDTLPLENSLRNAVGFTCVQCTPAELYNWIVANRAVKREYDSNYKKHPKEAQWGKKGVVISPMTYSITDAQDLLDKAVGSKGDKKNLFRLDASRNMLVVFWDENLTPPKYHGYEIPFDEKKTLQVLYNKNDKDLLDKIILSSTL